MGQGSFAEDEDETELGKETCDAEKEPREQKEIGDVAKGTNKRKRRTKEDKFERALQTVVDKVTQAQKESDMLLKLEEKRMKFDERMMEMEDRRLREDKERVECQRREDRDFQLRMMMMMQHSRAPPPPPPPHFPPGFNYSFHNSSGSSESSQWPDPDVN